MCLECRKMYPAQNCWDNMSLDFRAVQSTISSESPPIRDIRLPVCVAFSFHMINDDIAVRAKWIASTFGISWKSRLKNENSKGALVPVLISCQANFCSCTVYVGCILSVGGC